MRLYCMNHLLPWNKMIDVLIAHVKHLTLRIGIKLIALKLGNLTCRKTMTLAIVVLNTTVSTLNEVFL